MLARAFLAGTRSHNKEDTMDNVMIEWLFSIEYIPSFGKEDSDE